MEERIVMLRELDSGAFTGEEVAARHQVSRETLYYWKRRRDSGEERWYADLSRAPDHCPHTTPRRLISSIVAMRKRYPRFGPKKIRACLMAEHSGIDWPASSTIGDILQREGLIVAKARRQRGLDQGEIVAGALEPNGEWSIDFKGWFRTLDGERCDPLTIEDTASRYLIETRIVDPTWAGVRCACERVFEEFGLPKAIRSDNGPPFGSTGAGGLSALAAWWVKLGIEPRYIPPASPQDNGRHERMHRTLKAETARPPARTICEQQARFDRFRAYYNEERPHEALGQVPPARLWRPSERRMPDRVDDPWYDADHEVRRVRTTGEIKWRGESVFVSETFAGELVGLAELESGAWLVRFSSHDLGFIDRTLRFHRFAPPRARLRSAVEPQRAGTDEE